LYVNNSLYEFSLGFICTDVALFWFHHSTGLCYMFLT